MVHRKKTKAGVSERLDLLRPVFPDIEHFLQNRPRNAGKGDLLVRCSGRCVDGAEIVEG
jgi:hypothetical protein